MVITGRAGSVRKKEIEPSGGWVMMESTRREKPREPYLPGLALALGVAGWAIAVTLLFALVRPPTVEDVERDIWSDWARLATDAQGRTIVDLLLDGQQPAAQQLVESLGKLIDNDGGRFVVRTTITAMEIRDAQGKSFANWVSPAHAGDWDARKLRLELRDPAAGNVGVLEVGYRFYAGGLDHLPNIRRLNSLYRIAFWLVGALVTMLGLAVVANGFRVRERAARLRGQQITLDLAHQMCHELRNALWAFSLESKNLKELYQMVDDYLVAAPLAASQAADQCGLSDVQKAKFARVTERLLVDQRLSPSKDLAACNQLAKQAHQQIDSFARFLNLTVEELDRHLLGVDRPWQLQPARIRELWREATSLLTLRLRSANVQLTTQFESEHDWVLADESALTHGFVNLIKNALEAMSDWPGEKRIALKVQTVGDRIETRVRNSGRPIPAETLPHIFNAGFSTKSGAGRGAGLALVREAVERMHGQISVDNDPEKTGQSGVEFILQLPRAVSASNSVA